MKNESQRFVDYFAWCGQYNQGYFKNNLNGEMQVICSKADHRFSSGIVNLQVLQILQLTKLGDQLSRQIRIPKITERSYASYLSSNWTGRKKIHWKNTVCRRYSLHSNNTIVTVTSNMKPCTWVDKSWIPTLQNIIRII